MNQRHQIGIGLFPFVLTATFICFALVKGSLHGQTVNLGTQPGGEKRPTPEDPSYQESVLTPTMRRAQENNFSATGALLLNPAGSIDMQAFTAARQKQEEAKAKAASRRFQREIDEIPGGRERVILERSVMRQFGVDEIPYQWRKEEPHHETGWRRFQVTFFLSMPITMGAVYVIARGLKSSAGQSARRYTGGETAGMVFTGLLFSGGIAFYDYIKWKELPSSRDEETKESEKQSYRAPDVRDWIRADNLPLYRLDQYIASGKSGDSRFQFGFAISF